MKLVHLVGSTIAWPFFWYILLILLKSPLLALFCSFFDFVFCILSLLFLLILLFFNVLIIGPRLKTGGTYRIRFVRPSIRARQLFSKMALRIFLKLGMKLGIHRGLNVLKPFFFINIADFAKIALFGPFWPFFAVFWILWKLL